jgi:hypothetical protein
LAKVVLAWRKGLVKDSRIGLMREARRENEDKIQLLKELVKLQTEAIELVLPDVAIETMSWAQMPSEPWIAPDCRRQTQPNPLGFFIGGEGASFWQVAYRLPTRPQREKDSLLFS